MIPLGHLMKATTLPLPLDRGAPPKGLSWKWPRCARLLLFTADGHAGPSVLPPRICSAPFPGPDVSVDEEWEDGAGMQGWGRRKDMGRRNSILSPL